MTWTWEERPWWASLWYQDWDGMMAEALTSKHFKSKCKIPYASASRALVPPTCHLALLMWQKCLTWKHTTEVRKTFSSSCIWEKGEDYGRSHTQPPRLPSARGWGTATNAILWSLTCGLLWGFCFRQAGVLILGAVPIPCLSPHVTYLPSGWSGQRPQKLLFLTFET